jgi:tRNA uridine 5-carboxymethylaminomethyl modification enzyme
LRREWGRGLADQSIEQIETATRYAGYIEKQAEEVGRAARSGAVAIPADLDYAGVHALSFEARQVLARHRPTSLGAAAGLPGITPAAISLLSVHLKKSRCQRSDAALADPTSSTGG